MSRYVILQLGTNDGVTFCESNWQAMTFTVGMVWFRMGTNTLMFGETNFSRHYQLFLALSTTAFCLVGAAYLTWKRPLEEWLDSGVAIQRFGSLGLLAFCALTLVLSAIAYRRGGKSFVLSRQPLQLETPEKPSISLAGAEHVSIKGYAGEASAIERWDVEVSIHGRAMRLPLLSFGERADALRMAEAVSQTIAIPIR